MMWCLAQSPLSSWSRGGGGGHYSALINAMVALSTGSLYSVQLYVPPLTSSMHARVALQSALINAIVAVDTGPFFLVHWLTGCH